MLDAIGLAAAFIGSTCGMALLALAMKVHWQQVRGDEAQPPRVSLALRWLGAGALCLSLWACLATDHVSMASLVWVMLLAASALTVAFILNWQPRWLGWMVAWVPTQPAARA